MNKLSELAPGVLAAEQLNDLLSSGCIITLSPETPVPSIDSSALDLRVGTRAWRLKDAQRPTTKQLSQIWARSDELTPSEDATGRHFEFQRGQIYLVSLDHFLDLPDHVSARATGKSSIGRLDIITRLITENGEEYDVVPAGYTGNLYLLVLPQTFSIRIAPGQSLNQLRCFSGPQVASILTRDVIRYYGRRFCFLHQCGQYEPWNPTPTDPLTGDPTLFDLTVNLSDESEPFIFKAINEVDDVIDLRHPFKGTHPAKRFFEKLKRYNQIWCMDGN